MKCHTRTNSEHPRRDRVYHDFRCHRVRDLDNRDTDMDSFEIFNRQGGIGEIANGLGGKP